GGRIISPEGVRSCCKKGTVPFLKKSLIMTPTTLHPVPAARRGLALRAGLLAGLLCVGLAGAWKFWPSTPVAAPPPNWGEVDKALLVAVRDGDHARVQELLDQGADVNARGEAGDTALAQAALNAD